MRASKRETERIKTYVEAQAHEAVVHLEKSAAERVGPVRHDIWDVHCTDSRWWVITEPTNLYDQADFKSRDVALTFHIGLAVRISYLEDRKVPVRPEAADLLPGSWRRWEQAFEAYDSGDEAEAFQSVGVRLRECLVSFLDEVRTDRLVPAGKAAPKGADFKGWTELLANFMAPGSSNEELRSYLKKVATGTWDYVNGLTHNKTAISDDAEIALKVVEHLLGVFTAARFRFGRAEKRCEACSSYDIVAGICEHCGWDDPAYETPKPSRRRRRLPSGEHTLSSDISTFISPADLIEGD